MNKSGDFEESEEKDENKDELSQDDIRAGKQTFGVQTEPHPALETKDGKNDGAKPAAYGDQQSSHP